MKLKSYIALFETVSYSLSVQYDRTVKIDDLTPGGVRSLLQYLYTDTTPNLMENAFQLLHAAEKYQFDHLKKVGCNFRTTKVWRRTGQW